MFQGMAVRQIIMSDISGNELDDDTHTRVVIDHPDMTFPIELDISLDEASQLQSSSVRLATIKVFAPNQPPRTVAIESTELAELFDGVDFDKVLAGGRKADKESTPTRTRRSSAAPSSGEKKDYSSPEWAGVEHRGRTTEAEASWVRENLEAANANRAREGQAPIDPQDEKFKKRYGF
jgi:hypothetical protein